MRKLLVLAVVVGMLSVTAVATAAPPNNRQNDSIQAHMHDPELFDIHHFGWQTDNDTAADYDIWVYDADVPCGANGASSSWTDDGSTLTFSLTDLELMCEDGSTRTVSLEASWTYSGKWGPTHYSEQGLQCKGKHSPHAPGRCRGSRHELTRCPSSTDRDE